MMFPFHGTLDIISNFPEKLPALRACSKLQTRYFIYSMTKFNISRNCLRRISGTVEKWRAKCGSSLFERYAH